MRFTKMKNRPKLIIPFSKLTPISRMVTNKIVKEKGILRKLAQQMKPFSQRHQRKETGGLMRIFSSGRSKLN